MMALVWPGSKFTVRRVSVKSNGARALALVVAKKTLTASLVRPKRLMTISATPLFSGNRNKFVENENDVSSFSMKSVALRWPPSGTPPAALVRKSRTVSAGSTTVSLMRAMLKVLSVSPGAKLSVPFVPR